MLLSDGNANQLNTTTNKSQVYGLAGNDTLTADGKSNVLLIGGSGNDSLVMSGGNGTLSGGAGNDTFELTYSATKKLSATIEDLDPANDKIIVNFVGNTTPQLTSSTTSNGNVILRDNSGNFNVTLNSVRDNDYFDGTASEQAWQVLELTNILREAEGLSLLTLSDGLTAGADIRVQEITKKGNLGLLEDHTRLDNKTSWLTVFNEIGKSYVTVGENLDGGAEDVPQVMREWINSPSHSRNIFKSTYKKLGVGYNEDDPDPTNHRFYWTQWFAAGLNSTEKVTVSTADLLTATPEVHTVSKAVTLTEDPDNYSNSKYGATIEALGGEDKITNSKPLVSISGGADSDTIQNSGSFTTINAGAGDDSISLSSDAQDVFIDYTAGDGSDTVTGFKTNDTISISGGKYYAFVNGNNVIVAVGNDSITLLDAVPNLNVYIDGEINPNVTLTEGADVYENTVEGATIAALGGNDTIDNGADMLPFIQDDEVFYYSFSGGSYVSINGGAGDDSLFNNGNNSTITGGDGHDSIDNLGAKVSIAGGQGDDSINNYQFNSIDEANDVTIDGGAGNDNIYNQGSRVKIDAGDGNNRISNSEGDRSSIKSGSGNDDIRNERGSNVSIDAGDGDDTIDSDGADVTIIGGAGDDHIINNGESVKINGGSGNETIVNYGSNSTINAGADNDRISFSGSKGNNLLQYTAGDGRDSVLGFSETDTLRIGNGNGTYSVFVSGNDVIVKVGTGRLILVDATNLSQVNIEGVRRAYEGEDKSITLTEGNDTYSNTLEGATVEALGGNDTIDNTANNVLISGNADNDYIDNKGNNVTLDGGANNDTIDNSGANISITGGTGDDQINLSSDAQKVLIQYTSGDGSDTVSGFKESDSLRIGDGTGIFSTQTSGNDIIVNVGAGSVTLLDATDLSHFIIDGISNRENILIPLTENDDIYRNVTRGATIAALGGNDSVENKYSNISINGGTGDDTLYNTGSYVSIVGGTGQDSITNYLNADFITIDGGTGDDSISNRGSFGTLNGGEGDDFINNYGSHTKSYSPVGDVIVGNSKGYISITGGKGNDRIYNTADQMTIDGGEDDDYIDHTGAYSTIYGGAGNDTILNVGDEVMIDSGADDDFIDNGYFGDSLSASNVFIDSGAGNDYIRNFGWNVTIAGGKGNDRISLSSDTRNHLIEYSPGDGEDTIFGWGSSPNSTISIVNGTYSEAVDGDDIILIVGDGSIRLVDARNKPDSIIIGDSDPSGGPSNDNGGKFVGQRRQRR